MKYIFTFIILTGFNQISLAEIYKWRDESGKLHISDKAPEKGQSTEINVDELVKQSGGVNLSKPSPGTTSNTEDKPEEKSKPVIQKKPKYTTNISKRSTLLNSCTKHGYKKCFYPEDETLCILRYGIACEDIHFWKENAKQAYQRRSGETHQNPYFVLANRPMGLIESHIGKTIPTHRNTNRKNLRCLKKNGFFCAELSNHAKCQKTYDMSCNKLRTWKEDAIKRCENSHGVNCDSDEYLKNYRPLSIEEYNRNSNVTGSSDSFLLNKNFLKDDKKDYKAIQKLLSKLDGR